MIQPDGPDPLAGRVAMITGAGQGIGRALAIGLAAAGAHVAIAELDPARAQSVTDEIAGAGGRATVLALDVTDAAAVTAAVQVLADGAGPPSILINNARWSGLVPTPAVDLTDEAWRRALDVNVTGAFNCARACIPGMAAAGWGRIVNVSSSTARLPPRQPYTHYITTKAALIGMTRALARELGTYGITVNALLPGAIDTGIARHLKPAAREERARATQAIPRVGLPEDLLGAVLFLAGDDSGFITGQSLAVDGGYSYG